MLLTGKRLFTVFCPVSEFQYIEFEKMFGFMIHYSSSDSFRNLPSYFPNVSKEENSNLSNFHSFHSNKMHKFVNLFLIIMSIYLSSEKCIIVNDHFHAPKIGKYMCFPFAPKNSVIF